MRLKTSKDPDNYKNSVITLQKVREKEWKRISQKQINNLKERINRV